MQDLARESRLPDQLKGLTAFRISTFDFDPATWSVRFHYSFDDRLQFAEVLTLPRPQHRSETDPDELEGILRLLHIAAGTSYWKLAATPTVLYEPGVLTAAEAAVAHHCYEIGMREFAYRNQLPVPVDVEVRGRAPADPIERNVRATPRAPETDSLRASSPDGADALIPVGGGKDSALCASLFPRATMFSINAPEASIRVAEAAGRPLVTAVRRLDPLLIELNGLGALNGHVPVTAITSLVSALVAHSHGLRDVVMGIERSASEPTRVVNGTPVNHQHAKSWEFEGVLRRALSEATGDGIRWFSALRPFSELSIARALTSDRAQMSAFLSCNRAFRISDVDGQSPSDSWCLECPKCLFTFLVFAPFLTVERAEEVFGGNPLRNSGMADKFSDLFSHEGKPFECVGELLESAVAMQRLASLPGWERLPVVTATAAIAGDLARANDATLESFLDPQGPDAIPEEYCRHLHARLAGAERED